MSGERGKWLFLMPDVQVLNGAIQHSQETTLMIIL
jgi:hypothetical protein